ncbi:MAG: gamma-glutamylcyclotransferase [Saprospiraceae bacterium]|nr:gamma-glutamylcyclotransferase [Saprospiraceae bacterium]
MMTDLFTYGTLMVPAVWRSVVEDRYRSQTAWLSDFQRLTLKNQVYPSLIPAADQIVQGVLYLDISPDDLCRIDDFEGNMYERIGVGCTMGKNESVKAQTYLLRNEFHHLVSQQIWSLSKFLEQGGLDRFLEDYPGWSSS